MERKISMLSVSALLFSILMMSAACAEKPSAVFDMEASGDARMTVTEAMSLDIEEMSISASAAPGTPITFSGSMYSAASAAEPDYTFEVSMQGTMAIVTFSANGQPVNDFLSLFGDVSLQGTMANSGGDLSVDLTATMGRKMFEEQFLLNATLIQEDPEGFRTDMESLANELLSALGLPQAPQISISELTISGADTLTITIKMTVSDWNDFLATLVGLSYSSPVQGSSFLNCLGTSPESLTAAMLGAGVSTTVSMSSSGSSISGRIEINSESGSVGGVFLNSFNVLLTKTGSRAEFFGSASLSDVGQFITCAMQDYLPGDYTVDSLSYSLVKTQGSDATQVLETDITSLAEASNGNLEVSFMADFTDSVDVTVNAPSSMDIVSVSGGTKSSRSATASGGEDFTVVYGKGGGFDMTLVIVAVVIVLILALLLRPKKGEKRRK